MNHARDIALADALCGILTHPSRGFSLQARGEVVFAPDWREYSELKGLQLGITPGLAARASLDRAERPGVARDRWQIDLFITQLLNAGPDTQIRSLLAYLDELLNFLLPFRHGANAVPLKVLDGNGETWICAGWDCVRRYDPNAITRERHGHVVTYTGTFFTQVQTYWSRLT